MRTIKICCQTEWCLPIYLFIHHYWLIFCRLCELGNQWLYYGLSGFSQSRHEDLIDAACWWQTECWSLIGWGDNSSFFKISAVGRNLRSCYFVQDGSVTMAGCLGHLRKSEQTLKILYPTPHLPDCFLCANLSIRIIWSSRHLACWKALSYHCYPLAKALVRSSIKASLS